MALTPTNGQGVPCKRVDYNLPDAYDAGRELLMVGQTVTHYRILRKLGSGGMGEVYEAEDLDLDRRVALKFLTAELASKPEAVERFQREARMASALNHPNICTVHEIGKAEGQYFIVTELLEGENLEQVLSRGALESDRICQFAMQIADALAAAHSRGIVHRDLKPSNIFITDRQQVKVLDFGIAKSAESGTEHSSDVAACADTVLTAPGTYLGTLSYMSPEQLRNAPISTASDVFSFGIVLWTMLTGVHPFAKKTLIETASSILSDSVPGLDGSATLVPSAWMPLLEKMLRKAPSDRYPTAQELRDDLVSLQGDTASGRHAGSVDLRSAGPSVAVLPFRNLNRDPDNDYFSDGLAEELINVLSNLNGVRVAARSSSFRFRGKEADLREIGRQLNVSSVFEGSVQRQGDRIRIMGQLVSVADGFHLWSGKFDRDMSDVFAVQDEIAQAVVANLESALSGQLEALPARRRPKPEIYNRYLQGRFFWNKRTEHDLRKAIECFRQAVDRDSSFAPAWAGIADSHMALAIYGAEAPSNVVPLAKAAARTALELDARLAEAHTSLGCAEAVYDWNWSDAERHFRAAIQSSPKYAIAHHWYATNCLLPRARFTEARQELQHACELEPLSLVIRATLGLQLLLERQHDSAMGEFEKVISMDYNFGIAHFFLGQVYAEKRMFAEAIRELEVSCELTGDSPESLATLGWAYARAEKHAEATRILEDLRQRALSHYVSPVLFAQLTLGLGEKQEALEYLSQARSIRASDLIWVKVRPAFDELQKEDRFAQLCLEIGLLA